MIDLCEKIKEANINNDGLFSLQQSQKVIERNFSIKLRMTIKNGDYALCIK